MWSIRLGCSCVVAVYLIICLIFNIWEIDVVNEKFRSLLLKSERFTEIEITIVKAVFKELAIMKF